MHFSSFLILRLFKSCFQATSLSHQWRDPSLIYIMFTTELLSTWKYILSPAVDVLTKPLSLPHPTSPNISFFGSVDCLMFSFGVFVEKYGSHILSALVFFSKFTVMSLDQFHTAVFSENFMRTMSFRLHLLFSLL